jgi:superfamily II DNA helicase RecQ
MPKSLTNYYQESGRAGRDGSVSECVLFFSYKDRARLMNMIMRGNEERGVGNKQNVNENLKRTLYSLNRCLAYCLNETDCRRVMLLEYFGEAFPVADCRGTCDNCYFRAANPDAFSTMDATIHARNIIRLVKLFTGQNSGDSLPKLTLKKLAMVYSRSKDKDLARYISLFERPGFDSSVPPPSKDMAERIIQQMVVKNYLEEEHVISFNQFGADYVILGELGDTFLSSREAFTISLRGKASSKMQSKSKLNQTIEEETDISKEIVFANGVGDGTNLTSSKRKAAPKRKLDKVEQISNFDHNTIIEIDDDRQDERQEASYPGKGSYKRANATTTRKEIDLSSDDLQRLPSDRHNSQPTPSISSLLSKKQKTTFRTWLESFRRKWVNYWNYLNNACIDEIVERVPLTMKELASISGIGESKAHKHGDSILATIHAFLEANDLLHLFPHATPPTIPDCPTWKDPLSSEAEAVRKSLTEQPSASRISNSFQSSTTVSPNQIDRANGTHLTSPEFAKQMHIPPNSTYISPFK